MNYAGMNTGDGPQSITKKEKWNELDIGDVKLSERGLYKKSFKLINETAFKALIENTIDEESELYQLLRIILNVSSDMVRYKE